MKVNSSQDHFSLIVETSHQENESGPNYSNLFHFIRFWIALILESCVLVLRNQDKDTWVSFDLMHSIESQSFTNNVKRLSRICSGGSEFWSRFSKNFLIIFVEMIINATLQAYTILNNSSSEAWKASEYLRLSDHTNWVASRDLSGSGNCPSSKTLHWVPSFAAQTRFVMKRLDIILDFGLRFCSSLVLFFFLSHS